MKMLQKWLDRHEEITKETMMKSFYEMLIIMEGLGEDAKVPFVTDQEKLAFEVIRKGLDKAGLPWDQEEFNVLYGKFVDMDIYVSSDRKQRIQGMVDADSYENDGDRDEPSVGRLRGFKINDKKFNPLDIATIHSMRVQLTYDALFDAWSEESRLDRDYERTLRMLPR